ncbi:MAG: universal stress protein [Glaciimonas sp.]|nr:universal stress protein [Glaciimonas sp.]
MSFKTILVHVDESKHAADCIRIASEIALTENAHLIGAAMTGVSRYLYRDMTIINNDPGLVSHMTFLRERASRALQQFEPLVQKIGVSSFEQRVIDDEAAGGICLQARYSDLVVIGQIDPAQPSTTILSDFPEYVLIHSGRPVLMIPYTGYFEKIGKRILIAWDGSKEATRAVTNAIPLLKRAEIAHVVIFNNDAKTDTHSVEPGADIALYLARHGVKVEISLEASNIDIGNSLLSLSSDMHVDMIVMGGYGHSRFRETILGGATRTMMQSMTVPVLMSH